MLQYNHPRLIVSLYFQEHSPSSQLGLEMMVLLYIFTHACCICLGVSEDLCDSCHSQKPPKQICSAMHLSYSCQQQCEWIHSGLSKQGDCRVSWRHPASLFLQFPLLFWSKMGKPLLTLGEKAQEQKLGSSHQMILYVCWQYMNSHLHWVGFFSATESFHIPLSAFHTCMLHRDQGSNLSATWKQ